MKGNDQADRHTMQSDHHRWLVARKICSIEKLDSPTVSTVCQIQIPPTAWRRAAKKEEALSNKNSLGKTRKGQSDQHWHRFKGNTGETSARWGAAHMGFFQCVNSILNWTEWQNTASKLCCISLAWQNTPRCVPR